MFLEVLLISLLISKIRGGKLSKLLDLDLKGFNCIYLLLFTNFFMMFLYYKTNFAYKDYLSYINIFNYLIYILLLAYNIRLDGVKILMAGIVLNFIPVCFYKGKMPVDILALEKIGKYKEIELLFDNKILTHTLLRPESSLKILSDFIALGKDYFFPKVISIGDIFLGLGIFIFIYNSTRNKREMKED